MESGLAYEGKRWRVGMRMRKKKKKKGLDFFVVVAGVASEMMQLLVVLLEGKEVNLLFVSASF